MDIPCSSEPFSEKCITYNVSYHQDMLSAEKCLKSLDNKSVTDDQEKSRSSNFPLTSPYIAAYLVVVGKLSLHYFIVLVIIF